MPEGMRHEELFYHCRKARCQDQRLVVRNRDRELEVRRERSVRGHHGPVVIQHPRLLGSQIEHWLDAERHALEKPRPPIPVTIVRHVGIFVESPADSVPAIALHDAVSARRRERFDRVPDLAEPVARLRGTNAFPERLLRVPKQLSGFVGDVPDRVGPCRVSMPSVDDRAEVERYDIALLQHPLPGESMNDLFVHGRANRAGETVIPEEVCQRPELFQGIDNDRVELAGGDARLDRWLHPLVADGHDVPRLLHLRDVLVVLDRDWHSWPCLPRRFYGWPREYPA